MSETIVETIIPGTYIEVRAEGLLTVGAIATGNVGIIGTAEKGSSKIETLSSFEKGLAVFGEAEPWDPNADGNNLTLIRGLKLLFNNGARTVYARRVLNDTNDPAVPAVYSLLNESGASVELKAKTPGRWGNKLQILVEEADAGGLVSNELVVESNGSFKLSGQEIDSSKDNIGNVSVKENGILTRIQLKKTVDPEDEVQLNTSNGTLTFKTKPSSSAEVRASYWVTKRSLRKITLKYGNVKEFYTVPSIRYLAQLINDEKNPSKLVEASENNIEGIPEKTTVFKSFTEGKNGGVGDYQTALDDLVDKNIQILLVTGKSFTEIKSSILGHVEKTENLGRERIAVVGADDSDVEKILGNVNEVADKRVILVAPGIKQKNPQTGRIESLPPYFTAATVAGKLASVSPHISLTNKSLAGIDNLAAEYNYGNLKALVENRVLALQKKRGIRVVKGITTHDEAFKQISIRRIIDYIKEGTRRGANQYIGKLNNPRVRSALHTTLNGFLTDMLTREFLTGYKLEVFADRAMEIRGEVQVIMDLNPTFSIDVIRVIMNLS
ncbi:MAG: phage tail sheath subtilisin-like domain-containing protein [Desulfobacteraceae bacterium]|nr:phage tail sheath subtilisin-like domain-containing protein [Desulfobacteraceae bacterium]